MPRLMYQGLKGKGTLTHWRKYCRMLLRRYIVPRELHRRVSRACRSQINVSRATQRSRLIELAAEMLHNNWGWFDSNANMIRTTPYMQKSLFDDDDDDDE